MLSSHIQAYRFAEGSKVILKCGICFSLQRFCLADTGTVLRTDDLKRFQAVERERLSLPDIPVRKDIAYESYVVTPIEPVDGLKFQHSQRLLQHREPLPFFQQISFAQQVHLVCVETALFPQQAYQVVLCIV
jgi:hypothetical protein